ncbi:MFS family permease [Kibdelosporangium banguiense]|uniref:MFS family permease n=1 Tax=Kibdelosporangium banguiense TaxID=1365924 RepID=A0ABS4U013_9PSEU|nr:MFS transporter [Kibdelosporangium banguiense]MBP2330001.1 MFS family permease [Kibdelosporangium banguiense]
MSPRAAPVFRLWLAVLLGNLAFGGSLQALPELVVQRLHSGPVLLGFAVGLAFAATALSRPVAGYIADCGYSRRVVLAGSLLTAIGGIGQLLASNAAILLAARVLMGVGDAALFSGALPWVLAGTPEERRGRVASWFGLSMWSGLALGPVLATLLQHWTGDDNAVWVLVIALGAAAAVPVLTTARPPAPSQERPRWREIIPRGAARPGLVLWLASYGYGTVSAFAVLFLQENHGSGETVPLTVFAAGYVLTRVAGGGLIDRFGGELVAGVSLLVELSGLAVVAVSASPLVTLVGLALAGIGTALVYPSTVIITLKRGGLMRAGASVGALTSCWDLGVMAAGPLGGIFVAAFGYPVAFAVAAGSAGASALVVRWMITRRAVTAG